MQNENLSINEENIPVKHGRHGEVVIYDVREDELKSLERGGEATPQLNFGIFLLSMGFTSLITLCTTTVKWDIMSTFFMVTMVVGILLGGYFIVAWKNSKRSVFELVKEIRDRLNGGSQNGENPEKLENE